MIVEFTLNGEETTARVTTPTSLLDVLRDQLESTGSKSACQQGECGSCSILVDGDVVCSCIFMAADVHGSTVTTIEGLTRDRSAGRVQQALNEAGAVQCGFCTPGIVVAASDLLARNAKPSTAEIKEALAGNVCRCTGYGAIVRALEGVARET